MDWLAGNVYWTEIDLDEKKLNTSRVMVSKIDGRYKRSVISTGKSDCINKLRIFLYKLLGTKLARELTASEVNCAGHIICLLAMIIDSI